MAHESFPFPTHTSSRCCCCYCACLWRTASASDVRFNNAAAVDLNTTVSFVLFDNTVEANAVITLSVQLNVTNTAAHTYNITVHALKATFSSIGQCSGRVTER